MRHRLSGRRLGRGPSHQKAMFRALAASLITHEQIETTDARAKELRRVADRLVTLGKKNTLHARRQAYSYLNNHQLVQKLFDEIAPRFASRPGGYTSLIKSRIRFADQAPMTFVRFVDREMAAAAEKPVSKAGAGTIEERVKAGVEEELAAAGVAPAATGAEAAAVENEEKSETSEVKED